MCLVTSGRVERAIEPQNRRGVRDDSRYSRERHCRRSACCEAKELASSVLEQVEQPPSRAAGCQARRPSGAAATWAAVPGTREPLWGGREPRSSRAVLRPGGVRSTAASRGDGTWPGCPRSSLRSSFVAGWEPTQNPCNSAPNRGSVGVPGRHEMDLGYQSLR